MKFFSIFPVLLLLLAFSASGYADPIGIFEVGGFVHGNGILLDHLDNNSANYFNTLNSSGLGSFGWTFTNTTGASISNVSFLLFLDAEIDEPINTYINEYGSFISLSLPPASPA